MVEWSGTRRGLTSSSFRFLSSGSATALLRQLLACRKLRSEPNAMLFTCYRTSRTQCSPCPILVKSTEGSSDCHPSRAAAPRRIILAILPARLDPLVSKACQVRTLLWGRNRLEHRRPFRVITARCLKSTEIPCLGTIFCAKRSGANYLGVVPVVWFRAYAKPAAPAQHTIKRLR